MVFELPFMTEKMRKDFKFSVDGWLDAKENGE